MLEPSSPWGYELRHAALHEKGDYCDAILAFEDMLSIIEQSPDPDIRRNRDRYVTPSKVRIGIRRIVRRAVRDLPRVLINTSTGRLHDRARLASVFEALPIIDELVSSITICIDRARIKHEVQQSFRYVMLSHTWEGNEPLFQQMIHMTVYELDQSPTHHKLQTFCKVVRESILSGQVIEDGAPPPSPDSGSEEDLDEEVDGSEDSALVSELPTFATILHTASSLDRETRARRLVPWLRQPFGALLVAPAPGQRSVDYRRVAAESSESTVVQIQKDV